MNNNENNNRNDNNYKGNNNNRSRPNSGSSSSSGGSGSNNDRDKEWQSGFIFTKNNSRPPGGKRRNDPWWMREEEKDNPRMLPFYRPWWLQKDINTIDDMKVNQLKDEAKLRGLDASGLKADLVQRLKESYDKFNLTDDCFTEPIYKKSDPKALPPCYPDIYENENEIKRLKLSDTTIAPPSS